jgi:geranyl-CoA carboxylase alpha subunit
MGEAATQAAHSVGYVGAGTVEFLLAPDGQFYFLEMNTRIQVEHPVTECVAGVDLVRLQFHVGQGRPLPLAQSDIALCGHAIEARLYAEDPRDGFLPTAGRVVAWRPGEGEGVRVDHGLADGGVVTPYYDSLLAKIIGFGTDRETARLRLLRAIRETFVAGVTTNRDFLLVALEHPEFVNCEATTTFVAASSASSAAPGGEAIALAALLFVERGGPSAPSAAWRESPLRLSLDGAKYRAAVRRRGEQWIVATGGETLAIKIISRTSGDIRFSCEGMVKTACYAREGENLWLDFEGRCLRFADQTYAPPERAGARSDGAVHSPISGVIVGVEANAGDRVRRGQTLATIEAMKMQYSIIAPIDGVVAEANAAIGLQAQARALLFEIRPEGGE